MSQIELARELEDQIKRDKTDYLILLENQNIELQIDTHKYWIDNALITTADLFAMQVAAKKTRL